MIDQNLIDISTDQAQQAVVDSALTPIPNLYLVNNVFNKKLVDKLRTYLTSNQAKWDRVKLPFRELITWDGDTVVEELHIVCNNITETVGTQYFGSRLNYLGIQIWRDTGKFKMDWHSDNELIKVALQVYLFDAPAEYGTTFKLDNREITIPYVHNTGYLAVTHEPPGIQHRPTTQADGTITRYSIYVVWSLEENNEEKVC